MSATMSRVRETRVAAIAQAVQIASKSASQNEIGVAPKWKAAVNGRESQRKLHCASPATNVVATVAAPTSVPIARAAVSEFARQREEQRAGDDRQKNRYEHQRHYRTLPAKA